MRRYPSLKLFFILVFSLRPSIYILTGEFRKKSFYQGLLSFNEPIYPETNSSGICNFCERSSTNLDLILKLVKPISERLNILKSLHLMRV